MARASLLLGTRAKSLIASAPRSWPAKRFDKRGQIGFTSSLIGGRIGYVGP